MPGEPRMVLCLRHNGTTFKHVAVPLSKDLGSPETAAEIARAFGVTATVIESLTIKTTPSRNSSTQELLFENLPLNLNGHDLQHKFNHKFAALLFGDGFYLDVKFKRAEGRRPSASEDPLSGFDGFKDIEEPL